MSKCRELDGMSLACLCYREICFVNQVGALCRVLMSEDLCPRPGRSGTRRSCPNNWGCSLLCCQLPARLRHLRLLPRGFRRESATDPFFSPFSPHPISQSLGALEERRRKNPKGVGSGETYSEPRQTVHLSRRFSTAFEPLAIPRRLSHAASTLSISASGTKMTQWCKMSGLVDSGSASWLIPSKQEGLASCVLSLPRSNLESKVGIHLAPLSSTEYTVLVILVSLYLCFMRPV